MQNKNVIVHVCFVLFMVCLYTFVCEFYLKTIILKQNMKKY